MDTLRVFLIYLKSIEQNLPLPKEHPYCSTCHCPLSSVWVSLFPRMWAKSWRHCHLWLGMALVIHQKRFSSFQFGNRMEWMPWGLMLALIATCPRGIFGGVQVTPIAIRFRICNSKKVWLWVRYLLINHWQKQSTCPTHTLSMQIVQIKWRTTFQPIAVIGDLFFCQFFFFFLPVFCSQRM